MVSVQLIAVSLTAQPAGRIIQNFNEDWKFYKGDITGGYAVNLDDSEWRKITLPHDWSIEGPFSKENASCTGYLPGGTGWYRKTFVVPDYERGRRIFIYFGGIYNNSEVWINGHYLGKRPNGYISFQYDLSPYLEFGGSNLLAVKVDHSLFADSRWYTGSGIYRDVKLITTEPVHIKQWGVHCRISDVTSSHARMAADVSLVNESGNEVRVRIMNTIMLGDKVVGKAADLVTLKAKSELMVTQAFVVSEPELWDTDNPHLYSLVTELIGRELLDNCTTKMGFRDIRFDADKGFFLNGKSMKLKGICMHHDAGTLGSAVPAAEIARRLDILKEMGCNAIRTSHNPFSTDFLDLCDEKGFLVIDEAFDEWELPKKKWLAGWNVGTPGKEGYSVNFREWAKRDLGDFVLRDRNHPSVIMWSIGNEVDYPNDPYTHPVLNTEANPQTWAKYDENLPDARRLGEVARELAAVIKELDTSRPVTAGLASALMSNESGYAEALDVAGYNYQEFRYAPDHEKYPERPLYGSENGMTLEMWNYVTENDYVMGQFLWTGFEYLGEAGRFPSRSNTAGVIDLAGNRKPEFYFRQSLWSEKPMVFLGTTNRLTNSGRESLWAHKRVDPLWNWKENETISVNAFTNCEEVELFLNGISLGNKEMKDFINHTITWEVPFEKGTLKAIARNKGMEAAVYELRTTGDPVRINAVVPFQDEKDLIHVFVTLEDGEGNTVYSAGNEIKCQVEGPAILLGMEDSNPTNTEDYKDNTQHAFHGRLLIYLKPEQTAGRAAVTLTSAGLESTVVELNIK
jgi:beta-galactosidase